MQTVKKNILNWPAGELDFSAGCLVMGVLNVTPDSFSDDGEFFRTDMAVRQGVKMANAGAAIIDVGPESSRPGARAVPPAEQIKRAGPVMKELAEKINVPISIDTRNFEVAKTALQAGAGIINDITALEDDKMAALAAERQVPVVLMHMQGTPATMQRKPEYKNVVGEVKNFLLKAAERAERFGVQPERIFIDPGIGFGKTVEQNLELLRHIGDFVSTGYRVLIGPSRKSFIGRITGRQNPAERIFGTAAAVASSVIAGVSVVRVHDVAEMVDVVSVANAVRCEDKTAQIS